MVFLPDPRDILAQFIAYNAEDSLDLGQRDEIHEYLSEDPTRWREPRNIPTPNTIAKRTVLVVAEEGAGKTTALREMEPQATAEGHIVLRLDFSDSIPLIQPVPDTRELIKRLDRSLRTQMGVQVWARGVGTEFDAAIARAIFSSGEGKISETLRANVARTDVENLADSELLKNSHVRKAVKRYKENGPNLGLFFVEAAQLMATHVVLVVDNVDHLPASHIPHVLATLSGLIKGNTKAYIALRPENEVHYPNFRQRRVTERVQLPANRSFELIARRRIDSAMEWTSREYPQLVNPLKSESTKFRFGIHRMISDPNPANLIESWLNGNLRQTLGFAAELRDESLATMTDSEVRSVVYDRLIRFSTPQYLSQVFSPVGITDTPYGPTPFVFLKLRLLAYLAAKPKRAAAMVNILRDFEEHFGVKPERVLEAIEVMEGKLGNSGAPLRRVFDDSTLDSRKSNVILLSAGHVFIDQIVYSCDFLAWLYDESPRPMPFLDPTGRSRRQRKFDKSVAVFENLILRGFEDEHPYLSPDTAPTPALRRRLRSYVQVFNYGPGRWFIGQMSSHLALYARERDLITLDFVPVQRRIRAYTQRLDAIYANQF